MTCKIVSNVSKNFKRVINENLFRFHTLSKNRMSLYINRIFSSLFFGHSPFEDIFVTANQFDNA